MPQRLVRLQAAAFLNRASAFLLGDEARYGLLLGIPAHLIRAGPGASPSL